MMTMKFLLLAFLWLWATAMVQNQNYYLCPNPDTLNVYAADDLSNGIVRLYQDHRYHQLSLEWMQGADRAGRLLATGNQSLVPVFKHSGQISELFCGLSPNFSFADTLFYHTTVFSLLDHARVEFTFVLVSEANLFHNQRWLPSRLFSIDTRTGFVVNEAPSPKSLTVIQELQQENESSSQMTLMAAWRLRLAHRQYLFSLIGDQMFWSEVDVVDFTRKQRPLVTVPMVSDENGRFHRGTIPVTTAAFAVQPTIGPAVLVLINCKLYCLVPLTSDGLLDFEPCQDLKRWQAVENWLVNSTDAGVATASGLSSETIVPNRFSMSLVLPITLTLITILSLLLYAFVILSIKRGTYHVSRMEKRDRKNGA